MARSAIGELLRASEQHPDGKNNYLVEGLNLSMDGLVMFLSDVIRGRELVNHQQRDGRFVGHTPLERRTTLDRKRYRNL